MTNHSRKKSLVFQAFLSAGWLARSHLKKARVSLLRYPKALAMFKISEHVIRSGLDSGHVCLYHVRYQLKGDDKDAKLCRTGCAGVAWTGGREGRQHIPNHEDA